MAAGRSLSDWVSLLAGPGRAAVVQWRFKGLSDAVALAGARELREATRAAGVLFIVNDRPDIARIVGADGVHVGQGDMDCDDVRELLPQSIVGVSTHNQAQFDAALGKAVDYIAVGPVFGTTSKANPDPVVGLEFVSWARTRTAIPLVGIGGLNSSNVEAAARAGADGVAVISELMKADRPDHAAETLVANMRLATGR
jgi:thiamine-phosphate pyrophosphorylase